MTKFMPAAKAWVAAMLPIVTAVVTDWSGSVDVDSRGYLGAALIATISFIAVYFTPNTTSEVDA